MWPALTTLLAAMLLLTSCVPIFFKDHRSGVRYRLEIAPPQAVGLVILRLVKTRGMTAAHVPDSWEEKESDRAIWVRRLDEAEPVFPKARNVVWMTFPPIGYGFWREYELLVLVPGMQPDWTVLPYGTPAERKSGVPLSVRITMRPYESPRQRLRNMEGLHCALFLNDCGPDTEPNYHATEWLPAALPAGEVRLLQDFMCAELSAIGTATPELRERARRLGDRLGCRGVPAGGGRRFLALGDSYTIGEGVREEERWPVRLAAMLRERGASVSDPTIVARTGWTTGELMRGIEAADPEGPFGLVGLLIGVNNQYRGRSIDEYREEFTTLLDRAVGFAGGEPGRVLVLSIPDWGVTPYAEGRDRARIAGEIDRFNAVNREEARRAGARYVDVTGQSRTAAGDRSSLAPDGLHPSEKMYAAWARLALPQAVAALGAGGTDARAGDP